jgi:hypothetical protein
MTAKEKLRQAVEDLSESEAADVLELIEGRRGSGDDLDAFLERAPLDDEPSTHEEDAAADIARHELEHGQTVSLEQARREHV